MKMRSLPSTIRRKRDSNGYLVDEVVERYYHDRVQQVVSFENSNYEDAKSYQTKQQYDPEVTKKIQAL